MALSAQTTTRASVDSFGAEGLRSSEEACISANGRFVAFRSTAVNLVTGDTNSAADIFVHDRVTGITERVSVDSNGVEADEGSWTPSLSADGRFVAFRSDATNLHPNALSGNDIYVHDRQTGITEIVSVDSSGNTVHSAALNPDISADGRFVTFSSVSDVLVPGDTNQKPDIFVYDRVTGIQERVSLDSFGNEGNQYSSYPAISADGRFVVFRSSSTNLVAGDTNGGDDVFLHDRLLGITERISVDSQGNQTSGGADRAWPDISDDGSKIVFCSNADDLVLGDNNRAEDIFVRDRVTGTTIRVSVNSHGEEANTYSWYPSISGDGNHVSFRSSTSDFGPKDTNYRPDIFVHDLRFGTTRRVSLSSWGSEGDKGCDSSSLSYDGRLVAFDSESKNLMPVMSQASRGIYVRDRWDGEGTNSFFLQAPNIWIAGTPLSLSWEQGESQARFFLAASPSKQGSFIHGHTFDLGASSVVLATGFLTNLGEGAVSITTPPSVSGHVLHFEVGTMDAMGMLYDSNVRSITFQ